MSLLSSEEVSLTVLVVDDELNIRKTLAACLEADAHQVVAVGSVSDALQAAQRRCFDIAFIDLVLGKESGLELIPQLLASSPWIKPVMMTAYASVDTAIESMKRGAIDYLAKPLTPTQVSALTSRVVDLRATRQRLAPRSSEKDAGEGPANELFSASPAMQRAFELAAQVAGARAPVLLRGESGTGKSVLARIIHDQSDRASKSFTVLACSSLSSRLLECELSGCHEGPFSGGDGVGDVAASEGGTLLLDEVGDLPLALQTKLLRFLQTHDTQRPGDRLPRQADVRLIGTTRVDLDATAAAGRFCKDLLYRLKVVEIIVPPLRERLPDVLPLARKFLLHSAAANQTGATAFTSAAEQAMLQYQWPGNLRELKNVVERAVILCRGPKVGVEHLLLQPAHFQPLLPSIGDPVPLERIEELHIRGVLSTSPSIEKAGQILGMDSVTLWRRRKKYRI